MAYPAYRSISSVGVGGTPVSCPTPTGAVAGDLMLAFADTQSSGPATLTLTANSGDWTKLTGSDVTNTFTGSSFAGRAAVWWAVFNGTTSYSWGATTTNGSIFGIGIRILAFSGADTASPIDVLSAVAVGTGTVRTTTFNATGITTTKASDLVLAAYLGNNSSGAGQTFTTPTGYTQRSNTANGGYYSLDQASPGATGTVTSTASASSSGYAWLIGIAAPAAVFQAAWARGSNVVLQ